VADHIHVHRTQATSVLQVSVCPPTAAHITSTCSLRHYRLRCWPQFTSPPRVTAHRVSVHDRYRGQWPMSTCLTNSNTGQGVGETPAAPPGSAVHFLSWV
jgi:hypothetical protein